MDESQGTVNTNGDCMRKQDGQSHSLPCIVNKSGGGCIVLCMGICAKQDAFDSFVCSISSAGLSG